MGNVRKMKYISRLPYSANPYLDLSNRIIKQSNPIIYRISLYLYFFPSDPKIESLIHKCRTESRCESSQAPLTVGQFISTKIPRDTTPYPVSVDKV